jgi:hypothetical protein
MGWGRGLYGVLQARLRRQKDVAWTEKWNKTLSEVDVFFIESREELHKVV